MNNVTLIGNVCRDFDYRQTANGTPIASNTIAVKRDRKEADGTYTSDFFDVYCFGAQADYAVKYIRKGDRISVAGSVHIRDYTTRNGVKGRAVEVSVTSIENLTPKESATTEATEKQPEASDTNNDVPVNETTTANETTQEDIVDDDLPF